MTREEHGPVQPMSTAGPRPPASAPRASSGRASGGRERGAPRLRVWSCGCASGEEPLTVSIVWQLACGAPDPPLEVLGTDVDPVVLERARRGCWPPGALRELPETWRDPAFEESAGPPDSTCARPPFRDRLRYALHDARDPPPVGPFDLVLCRNLVFTYFDEALQAEVLERLLSALVLGGALMVGRSERPPAHPALRPWVEREGIWVAR